MKSLWRPRPKREREEKKREEEKKTLYELSKQINYKYSYLKKKKIEREGKRHG